MKKKPDTLLELYNLVTDRDEKNDVAAKNPAIVAEMEKLLLEAREEPAQERFRFGKYE